MREERRMQSDDEQGHPDRDIEVQSKNLSEYASRRVSIGIDKKLKTMFKGFQNAEELARSSADPN